MRLGEADSLPVAVVNGLETARWNGHRFDNQCTYTGRNSLFGIIVFRCTNPGCPAEVQCDDNGKFMGNAIQQSCLGKPVTIHVVPEDSNAPARELALFTALVAYCAGTPEPLALLETQCKKLFPQTVIDRSSIRWQILYAGKYTNCPSIYLDISIFMSHQLSIEDWIAAS